MTEAAPAPEARGPDLDGWPVACPVDGRWARPDQATCAECGESLAAVHALALLARSDIDIAASSADPAAALRLVERAETLVAPSEASLLAAGDALMGHGLAAEAAARYEKAAALAPKRTDITDRLSAARVASTDAAAGVTAAGVSRRASRGRLVLWAGWVAAGAAGLLVVALLVRGTPAPGAAAGAGEPSPALSPAPSGVAVAPPATAPAATAAPSVSAPGPAPTASPSPTPEPLTLRAREDIAGIAGVEAIAVEEDASGVLHIAGPVADAATRDSIVARLTAAGIAVDASGLTLPAPSFRIVVLVGGDTFWTLAAREYGDPRQWRRIAAANPDLDPRGLTEGMRVRIPLEATP